MMSDILIDRKICKFVHSTSFLSPASQKALSTSGCSQVRDFKFPACAWRQHDVEMIFRTRDTRSINLLEKFGFVRRTDLPVAEFTPLSESWNFDPEKLNSETCGSTAGDLYQESLKKIKRIGFGSMVLQALGHSTFELTNAIWEYKWLHQRLYSHFLRNKGKSRLLLEMELNEIGADPFILYAVEDAHKCLQKGTSDGYDLIPILSHFITRPLQIHLNKPTSAIIILEQLEVLELRFKRHINGDWKGPLDTYTGYMDDFQKLGPYGFAEYLTQTEHTLYMKLSINSFRKYEGTTEEKRALRNLNYHSNEVAYLVSDSLKCRILSEDQWLRCATQLRILRNFFGFYAVKTGIMASDNSESKIKQLKSLLNGMRELDKTEPCLLPLFHATMNVERHKRLNLGEEAIGLSKSYSPDYTTFVGECGRVEDNVVQQSVQYVSLLPGIADSSALEGSSFSSDGDTTYGALKEENMMYSRPARSENVDDGQLLPDFRFFSFKSMFWFPCIGC